MEKIITLFNDEYIIRDYNSSSTDDEYQVLSLAKKTFSSTTGAYAIIPDINDPDYNCTFLVAINKDSNTLVGFSGYGHTDKYRSGMEITWTAVHPQFRRLGICKALVRESLTRLKSSGYTGCIYWSAWRMYNHVYPNAKPVLDKFGFRKVTSNEQTIVKGHNCNEPDDAECVGSKYCTISPCRCYTDLYCLDLAKVEL